LILGSKIDAMDNQGRLRKLRKFTEDKGLNFHTISSVTGVGIQELKYKIAGMLAADVVQVESPKK